MIIECSDFNGMIAFITMKTVTSVWLIYTILSVSASNLTTTPPSYTTAPSPSLSICSCNFSTSWNDVVFLISTSSYMTNKFFNEAVLSMQSDMSVFNVQNSNYTESPMYTRIGVISFGIRPRIIANLGSIDGDQLENINITYTNDQKSDLGDALQQAVNMFNNRKEHRTSSRKVIVIYDTYTQQGTIDPSPIAASFKASGGIIIVTDMLSRGQQPDSLLKSLASPGYFINTQTVEKTGSLPQALCDANCFCPTDSEPFATNSTRVLPAENCYSARNVSVNLSKAEFTCTSKNNGTLAKVDSGAKMKFLGSILSSLDILVAWIGLQWNTLTKDYLWEDKTTLGAYAPWTAGISLPPKSPNLCVSTTTTHWLQSDCRTTLPYLCQYRPCSTENYCT